MPAAGVDPDLQTVAARAGEHVGPSVPIDVRHDETQDHVAGAQLLHDRRAGQANVQLRDPRREIDAIVNAIAVEIGMQRVGQGAARKEQGAGEQERTGETTADYGHPLEL